MFPLYNTEIFGAASRIGIPCTPHRREAFSSASYLRLTLQNHLYLKSRLQPHGRKSLFAFPRKSDLEQFQVVRRKDCGRRHQCLFVIGKAAFIVLT